MDEYRRCRKYAIVVECGDDADIECLYELAFTLRDIIDHTSFNGYVDDKYGDEIKE